MKKYLNLMAFAMMAVFSLTFVSCSSDDDDDKVQQLGIDFIEITINGETKKSEIPSLGMALSGYQDEENRDMVVLYCEGEFGRMGDANLYIALYEYESDFNLMKSGTYTFENNGGSYNFLFENNTKTPFDAMLVLEDSDNNTYNSTNGTIVIKSITKRNFNIEGYSMPGCIITGTFSCTLENAYDSDDTMKCTGSFQVTHYLEED